MRDNVGRKPKEIAVEEKRRFIRHSLCFPLVYKIVDKGIHDDGKEARSKTINISMGGLLFAAKNPVEAGSTIIIKMPFENKTFNIRAKVVRCDKNPETKLNNIGVRFYRTNDAFKVKLIEQIYLISEYRDLKSMQLGRQVSLEEASREWIKRYSERFKRMYW
ncbi:MAG: PilZ domain-containing protein [Candidatus Omnitrophica bacterium]|nr:PilZ domain-containing protein [Candidatus Omnitrophota bacterium]